MAVGEVEAGVISLAALIKKAFRTMLMASRSSLERKVAKPSPGNPHQQDHPRVPPFGREIPVPSFGLGAGPIPRNTSDVSPPASAPQLKTM